MQTAVDDLYTARRIRLWVVYVDSFSGQAAETWARNTMRISDFQDEDAILAVATGDRAYAFLVPNAAAGGVDVDSLRRNEVEPALRSGDWAGAAVAAASGLNQTASSNGEISWVGVVVILAIIAIALLALLLWRRRRRRKRREAEFAAAQRVDPADPNALASVPIDALDDLSRSIVVDVDNAVRTSDNELALAVEEFGEKDTAPFTAAVDQRQDDAGAGVQRPPDPRRRRAGDAAAAARSADPGDRRRGQGRPRTRRPARGLPATARSGHQRARAGSTR